MDSEQDDPISDHASSEDMISDESDDEDGMFDMFTGQIHESTESYIIQDVEENPRTVVVEPEASEPQQEYHSSSKSQTVAEPTERSSEDIRSLNANASQPYYWAALEDPSSTRLLELLPADHPNEPVQGQMRTSGRVNYRAISYVWGPISDDDSHLTHSIPCDGRLIPVSSNLYQILKAVRNHLDNGQWIEFNTRPCIWVDAICINQRDVTERNHQVEMMASTYRNAQGLIIYLGEAEDDQDLALERTARIILAAGEAPDAERTLLDSLDFRKSDMESLLRRPWFNRRWAIQEFAMQKRRTVLFGRVAIQFEAFFATIDHFGLLSEAGLMKDVERFDGFRPYRWLLANLYRYRNSQCQRPHDVFFALMSFGCGCSSSGCQSRCGSYRCGLRSYAVDYNRTIDELMIQTAEKFIAKDAVAVLVLACCIRAGTADSQHDTRLPSWVPDWIRNDCAIPRAMVEFLEEHFRIPDMVRTGPTFYWPSETLFLKIGSVETLTVVNNAIQLTGWSIERPSSRVAVGNIKWKRRTRRKGEQSYLGTSDVEDRPKDISGQGRGLSSKVFPPWGSRAGFVRGLAFD